MKILIIKVILAQPFLYSVKIMPSPSSGASLGLAYILISLLTVTLWAAPGLLPNVPLTPQNLASYSGQSDIVIENGFFLNQSAIFTGNNITFRNCRFLWNSTSSYFWLLLHRGKHMTVENCEFISEFNSG